MSASPLGAVAPAPPQAAAPRAESSRAGGDGFARLLQDAPAQEAAVRPADHGQGQASAQQQGQEPDPPPSRPGAAEPAQEPAARTAGTSTAGDGDTGEPADSLAEDTWPPPGLAWLMPAPASSPVPVRTQPGEPSGGAGRPGAHVLQLPGLPADAAGAAALAEAAAATISAELPAGDDIAEAALLRTQPLSADTPEPPASAFVLPMAPATAPIGAAPAAAAATAAHLPTPKLHDAGFAEDVGSHVQWLAGQKISQAVIRISPQDLGPVEVRLQLDGDRLSADFSSAQPEVRQALEQGLSRLREMLGQHGFELAHAGVGHDQAGGRSQARPGSAGSDTGGPADEAGQATAAPVLRHRGLVDAYA